MKKCFKCGEEKPLSEFYEHPQMADGHLGKCKDCAKADARGRNSAEREAIRLYDHARNQKPKRRAARRRYSREHRARYPQKRSARVAVGNALRDGRLVKMPCAVCGSEKSEAHHTNYSKPLDVQWLCLPHHREADKRMKR